MGNVRLEDPQMLWLLPVVIALVVLLPLRSRAVETVRWLLLIGVIRLLWLSLCVVAMARPTKSRSETRLEQPRVVLLLDRSSSLSADAAAVDEARDELLSAIGPVADARTLNFAGEAKPVREAITDPSQTDIEAAIDVANRQNVDSANLHVVIVSDARQTRGDAVAAAASIAARGGIVSVSPVGRRRATEPNVVRVEPPVGAKVGLPSAVRVTMASDELVRGTVRLRDAAGRVMDHRELPLKGITTVLLHFTPQESGACDYTVDFVRDPAGSAMPAAAAGTAGPQIARIYVEGPPRLLLCDNFPDETSSIRRALEPLGLPIDVIRPSQWPDELAPYAAVIVSDFSGKELTPDQRGTLRNYVEQLGGGLVFIGGGNVLPSQWNHNTLAEALPFLLQERPAKVVKKLPEVSVCYVIDRSGSMSQPLTSSSGVAETSKLDLVKAAIQASVQSLPESASVAVVAFDTSAEVSVSATKLTDDRKKEEVAQDVDTIGLGGGTAMAVGINEGLRQLSAMPGDKYLVVLTDGQSQPPSGESWGGIADRAAAAKISWTSIAVGPDADQRVLESMATRAGGVYHFCGTADSVPKVFIQQANALRRVAEIPQKPFRPMPGADQGRYSGPAIDELPELNGSISTSGRPGADVLLVGERGAPLLASWQFGLGRVVAFASDAKDGWASRWVQWPHFGKFWQPLVQSVLRPSRDYAVGLRSRVGAEEVHFLFSVRDKDDHPVTELTGRSEWPPGINSANGPVQVPIVKWKQSRPGEYEASMPLSAATASRPLILSLTGEGEAVRYCAYLPELPIGERGGAGPDLESARSIADAGRGIVSSDHAVMAKLCQPKVHTTATQQPLWPWLIAFAILVWPIDVFFRKLA